MFDYTTEYLGLTLKNPLIISACSKLRDISYCQKLEEYGASAIVLPSLFEEEIHMNQHELNHYFTTSSHLSSESQDFLPSFQDFKNINGEEYLESIRQLKSKLSIPIIASLNAYSDGGWANFAREIEKAGASALELNIFFVPTNNEQTSSEIEEIYLSIIKNVKAQIKIPLAVKVGPYFTSFANMAKKIGEAKANGLVIFNRFLEPDFDLTTLDVNPTLEFSQKEEMRLTLHWTALLYKNTPMSLCSGRGVKDKDGFIKLLMAGADVVSIASVLYQKGPEIVKTILTEAHSFFEENEYTSIKQLKGSMSYKNVADPSLFERANYLKMLKTKHDY